MKDYGQAVRSGADGGIPLENTQPVAFDFPRLCGTLLNWYDRAGRDLPWRVRGTQRPDPYRVWLSEIMLQQTTVAAVIPYFHDFTRRWPDLASLAAAKLEDVLEGWAGLGYYARARNLHKCANQVQRDYDGCFPVAEQELLKLPGIGTYTAAAIASIAFDRRATIVDGNVERVIARLATIEVPLPEAKRDIRSFAELLTPEARSGDYGQAIMDLGATVCTPKSPKCDQCPWQQDCSAFASDSVGRYPLRKAPKIRPHRTGTAYWLESRGYVYLRRRPPTGLLGGMVEVPSSPWVEVQPGREDENYIAGFAPILAEWGPVPGVVRHTFTHFSLGLDMMVANLSRRPSELSEGHWVKIHDIETAGLPSVMLKLAHHAMAATDEISGRRP